MTSPKVSVFASQSMAAWAAAVAVGVVLSSSVGLPTALPLT